MDVFGPFDDFDVTERDGPFDLLRCRRILFYGWSTFDGFGITGNFLDGAGPVCVLEGDAVDDGCMDGD